MLISVSYRVTTRMLTRVVSKYLIFAVRYLVGRCVVAGLLPTPQSHAKYVASQKEETSCPEPNIVLVFTEGREEDLFMTRAQCTVKCLWD